MGWLAFISAGLTVTSVGNALDPDLQRPWALQRRQSRLHSSETHQVACIVSCVILDEDRKVAPGA